MTIINVKSYNRLLEKLSFLEAQLLFASSEESCGDSFRSSDRVTLICGMHDMCRATFNLAEALIDESTQFENAVIEQIRSMNDGQRQRVGAFVNSLTNGGEV